MNFRSTKPVLFLIAAIMMTWAPAQAQLDEIWTHSNTMPINATARVGQETQDWDGDGANDLLVVHANMGVEQIQFVSGRDGALLANANVTFVAPPSPGVIFWEIETFNFVGDVTGDGIVDFAILRRPAFFFGFGPDISLEVYDGVSFATVYSNFYLNAADSFNVASIHGAGDVNGDGIQDVAIALPFTINGTNLGRGRVRIIDIVASSEILSVFETNPSSWAFGETFARLGDVDNDGFDDFACGGPGTLVSSPFGSFSGNGGYLRAVSGATGASLWSTVYVYGTLGTGLLNDCGVIGHACRDGFGGFDADQDGIGDIMIPLSTGVTIAVDAVGAWSLVSGATGVEIRRFCDIAFTPGLDNIRAAGDVNGDSTPDFSSKVGSATRLVSGTNGSILAQYSQLAFDTALGDTNGDGFDDFVLSFDGPALPGTPLTIARSMMGTRKYGAVGTPLDLDYETSPTAPRLALTGATPFSLLFVGLATAPDNTTVFGIPVFIDLSTTDLATEMTDAMGEWRLFVSLFQPALAGSTVYLQAVEQGNGAHSNGLEVLLGG
ncbi:MAG: hypothetical protein V3W41_02485 [Planctomycetota bacterium]